MLPAIVFPVSLVSFLSGVGLATGRRGLTMLPRSPLPGVLLVRWVRFTTSMARHPGDYSSPRGQLGTFGMDMRRLADVGFAERPRKVVVRRRDGRVGRGLQDSHHEEEFPRLSRRPVPRLPPLHDEHGARRAGARRRCGGRHPVHALGSARRGSPGRGRRGGELGARPRRAREVQEDDRHLQPRERSILSMSESEFSALQRLITQNQLEVKEDMARIEGKVDRMQDAFRKFQKRYYVMNPGQEVPK